MHQDKQFAVGGCEGGCKRLAVQYQRLSVLAQAHGNRQRVVGGGKIVSQYAIERGQHGFTPWRRGGSSAAEQWGYLRQHRIEPDADHTRHSANASVDQAGDTARSARGRFATHG
jgi:hypothetical protein